MATASARLDVTATRRATPRGAAAVSVAAVPLLYAAFRVLEAYGPLDWSSTLGEGVLKVCAWVLPSLLVVALAYRLPIRAACEELGLWGNPGTGYAAGAIAAVPMLAAVHRPLPLLSDGHLIGAVLLGPFAEEVLFRGLLFRQLYRSGRRPVLRAMTVSALVFGAAHLANVDLFSARVDQWTAAGAIVGAATLGGLLFAWMTYAWNSIWPAVGLHSFLNLFWELTTGDRSPLVAGTRAAAVAVAIAVTIVATRRRAGSRGSAALARPPDVPPPAALR